MGATRLFRVPTRPYSSVHPSRSGGLLCASIFVDELGKRPERAIFFLSHGSSRGRPRAPSAAEQPVVDDTGGDGAGGRPCP